jgi:alkylation response protein AidB-like acyl-CoA dehydrogenase
MRPRLGRDARRPDVGPIRTSLTGQDFRAERVARQHATSSARVDCATARRAGQHGGRTEHGGPMSDTMETLSEADVESFRQRCREFLDAHATGIPGARRGSAGDDRGKALLDGAKKFQKALADAGLAGLTYPKEFGGQGLSRAYDRIWREEYGRYPEMTGELTISHGMCLPVLNDFGTTEQKKKFLAKNISGEQVWCQMFSEPGAGSDVASLQTRAERDGDEWVINGQKVWTTLAHLSDYGIPHQPGRAQARRHLDVHRRHEGPRGRRSRHPPDRRWHALQRGLLHEPPHPRRLARR